MAWIQQDPSGNFHISFRFGGRKFKRSLKTTVPKQAQLKKMRMEETIALVEAGRIVLPPNSDVPTFLLSEGKLETKHVVQLRTLDDLSEQFFKAIPTDGLEEGTIKMMQIHVRTLKRHLGSRFSVDSMKLGHLQGFINSRAGDTGVRGKSITASTIKKEVTTFRAIFTWAVQNELLAQSDFPSKGLRYPKIIETLPFQIFEAVQKQTAKLDPEDAEFQDLWRTVFLSMEEVEELLDHVQKTNVYPFVYPMFVFAAHTGARRGEIMRSHMADMAGVRIEFSKAVLSFADNARFTGHHLQSPSFFLFRQNSTHSNASSVAQKETSLTLQPTTSSCQKIRSCGSRFNCAVN